MSGCGHKRFQLDTYLHLLRLVRAKLSLPRRSQVYVVLVLVAVFVFSVSVSTLSPQSLT